MVALLKELGTLNRFSNSSMACVDIPLGPSPPPYCPVYRAISPAPTLTRICPDQGNMYDLAHVIKSDLVNQCTLGTKSNNYVHNTVRVGFDDYVPKCEPGSSYTLECVHFRNADMAISQVYRGLIYNCNSAPSGQPCVDVGTNSIYQSQLRLRYQILPITSEASSSDGMLTDTYIDPAIMGPHYRIKIWGINRGQFADLAYQYADNAALGSLVSTAEMNDGVSGTSRTFYANVEEESVCVYEKNGTALNPLTDSKIGCVARASRPVVKVDTCANNPEICPLPNHSTPKIVAKYEVGCSAPGAPCFRTRAAITPKNYLALINAPLTGPYEVNLAGDKYSSAVFSQDYLKSTEVNITAPGQSANFFGSWLFSPTSPNSLYLKGFDSRNGVYVAGGTHICLADYYSDDCAAKPEGCVVAKLSGTEASYNLADRVLPLYDSATSTQSIANSIVLEKRAGVTGASLANRLRALLDINYPGRQLPPPVEGENSARIINAATEGVRNKSAVEMGLCVPVPAPSACPLITEAAAGAPYGFSSFPQTNVGELATGICKAGRVGLNEGNSTTRYCVLDFGTGNGMWEPTPLDMECIESHKVDSGDHPYRCASGGYALKTKSAIEEKIPAGFAIGAEHNGLLLLGVEEQGWEETCYTYVQEYIIDTNASNIRLALTGAFPKGGMLIRLNGEEKFATKYIDSPKTCDSFSGADAARAYAINVDPTEFKLQNGRNVIRIATSSKFGPGKALFKVMAGDAGAINPLFNCSYNFTVSDGATPPPPPPANLNNAQLHAALDQLISQYASTYCERSNRPNDQTCINNIYTETMDSSIRLYNNTGNLGLVINIIHGLKKYSRNVGMGPWKPWILFPT